MKKIYSFIILAIIFFSFGCGKEETFQVTFDSLGGTSIESQIIEKGNVVSKPIEPQKEGFTFVEWQYNNEYYNFDTPVEKDIILKAFYNVKAGIDIVVVKLDYQNDTGVSEVKIAKGEKMSEPPNPQKKGYKFIGWYNGNDLYDFSTILNKDINLTVKWKYNKTETIESEKTSNASEDGNSNNTSNHSYSSTKCNHKNAFFVPEEHDKEHPLPTCTQKGYLVKYCPDCYKQWYEEVEALGHKIIETPQENGYIAPTCSFEGHYGAKEYCTVCKKVIKKGNVIPKDPRNHVGKTYIINKKEATWNENGYTGDTVCDSCKNNILSENKGKIISAHKNHSYIETYVSQTDKIQYKCNDGYIEYMNPKPITIPTISVVQSMFLPGNGVGMVGFTVAGGSLKYTVNYEIITDEKYMLNRFYLEKAENTSIWDYHLMLKEGYHIPNGTKIKIMINDSSGRTFNKTYTVSTDGLNHYNIN